MSRNATSAANLDALTNSELRELLQQHGFANTPVTNSTRTVLISRLRKRMLESNGPATKAKSRAASTTAAYLTRYSSAEESDRDTGPASMPPPATTSGSSSSKRKRATTHNSYSFFAPASTSSISYSSNSSSNNNNNHNLPTIKVPIQSRNSVYIPPPAVHASDTDESDSNNTTTTRTGGTNPYLSYGRLHGLSFPKRYSPAKSFEGSSSNSSTPVVNMMRSSVNNNASPRMTVDMNNSNSSGAEDSSPYVSDFTKRLLQFRDRNMAQDSSAVDRRAERVANPAPQPNPRYLYRLPSRHQQQQQHSVVHQAAAASDSSNNNSSISNPLTLFRSLYSRLDQQYGFRQNFVPFVLLSALVLFIAFLVFMYLTITPELVSTITSPNAKFVECTNDGSSHSHSLIAGESCIFDNDLEPSLDFLRLLVPELQARVERHMCIDPGLPAVLTSKEAVRMRVDSLASHDEYDTQRQLLHMVQYLVDQNPQWHISNVNGEGLPLSIAKIRQLPIGHATAFGILKPRLPLSCLFLRKLQTFFFVVGTLGLVTALTYAGRAIYQYWMRQKAQRQQQLNRLISHILQVVMEQAGNFPNNAEAAAVVVNHLRDKIVDPAQRTKPMEELWREAITFLEHHESRVQFEMGLRNGEECKLVRWVDTTSPPSPPQSQAMNHRHHMGQAQQMANGGQSSSSKPVTSLYNAAQLSKVGESMLTAKKWQSPAFDKTNKISSPPTPCLKIRQMFDKYEAANANLKTIISDAILEKVGPTCKIYDIFLEPQTCCVYVRCATAKDAGMVHDEINGWWFDNRLVSIKFLRLERFMDRFQESANNRQLLRPSNPQKLSLTQCNREEPDDDDDDEEEEEEEGEDAINGRG